MRRNLIIVALAVSLAASAVTGVTSPPAARAETGPSVPLPPTNPVPVTQQGRSTPTSNDETTPRALRGNQSGGAATLPGGGSYGATSLSTSATWNVSAQTGTFSWSYPLRVPPAPGELRPSLSLSYSSSAVDGLTSATNNQASWIGDGWSLWPGFVERSYGGCADDVGGTGDKPMDQCWRTDNATMSLAGGGSQLIRDQATGVWRPKEDDGSRVEQLFGTPNGDDNGETWKITTADGTQYFFGSRPEAKSTWTVPVFGDDAGEPCHKATFAESWCEQGYRWNLDKVVDRHGNLMLYSYDVEFNHYGRNKNSAPHRYVRGGWLDRVEYGLRDGDATIAPTGRLRFETGDRCVPGSDCVLSKPDNFPDVPLDLKCDGGSCPDQPMPTFWTTKRVQRIVAEVRSGAGFDATDSWTLRHELPAPGDGEKPALWLKGITHTGHQGPGPDESLPEVLFDGVRKPNRVASGDGHAALIRFRMNAITSETGGITGIGYAEPDCAPGTTMPAESNTKRCFPVQWAAPGAPERTDWFHKYVVAQVSSTDRIAGSLAEEVHYEYLDGAAWHFDESELTKEERKTWNGFRGYGRVVIRKGSGDDGPQTRSEQRFYRGMHGDRLPGGRSRVVNVVDSEGGSAVDEDWLNGQARESITYNGDAVVSKTITEPHWQGPLATRGPFKSYLVRPGTVRSYTALAAGGWRVTRQESGYDDRGFPLTVNDLGDVADPADDRCATTTYVRNTDRWLMSYPSRVHEVAVACGVTPVYPRDALSDTRMSYDDQGFGAPPVRGNATATEVLKERPAAGPVYAPPSRVRYDSTGRPVETTDVLGNITTTAYTPAVGGPVTRTTLTNAAGHVTTTTMDPASGQPTHLVDANGRVTETTYDALGRASEIWLANRLRSQHQNGNARFAYRIRNDGPTVVTTTAIGPRGNYSSVNDLFDGLLRKRQSQAPAQGGGRLLTDLRYDSQGRAFKGTAPYVADGVVDGELWLPTDAAVPGMTKTEYDGAGRQVATVFLGGGVEKWRTSVSYGGDRVHVTPPSGGTASTTLVDGRGRTTELRQYKAPTPTGEYDATKYTYFPSGSLASLVDPAGNTWRYSYDLRGRTTAAEDPDRGKSTYTYDDAGRVTSSTDARGSVLAYVYDELGRSTRLHQGTTAGAKLAEWTYDDPESAGIGMPASSTRYVNGNAYTNRVLWYDDQYRPVETETVIPAAEGALAGTYAGGATFNVDGSLAQVIYPAAGNLSRETVMHTYDDLGLIGQTSGGVNGSTEMYVSRTEHTRYGEVQQLQLGRAAGPGRVWLSSYYDQHTRKLKRTIVDAEVPKPMLADVGYTYDDAGNITSISDTPREAVADRQCFRYDHLRRLTEAWTPGSGCTSEPDVGGLAGPAPYWQSFTYDKVGNRLTETDHKAAGDTVREYGMTGHRLDSVTTRQPGGTTSLDQFAYDAAGNTRTRNLAGTSQTLEWDAEGRLAKATKGAEVTEFLYDANGSRLIRRDPTGTTLYLGGQELRLDKATKAVSATRYYEHGGAAIAMRDSSGLTWLAGDHQGTSQLAVNAATLAVTQRRQTPFGGERGSPVSFPGEKGFVGGTVDPSIGLITLGARQYDPATGRFISVDPVIDMSNPQQMHGYSYAHNSPVTYSDPSGLIPLECTTGEIECHGYNPFSGCPGGCGSDANLKWEEDRKRRHEEHVRPLREQEQRNEQQLNERSRSTKQEREKLKQEAAAAGKSRFALMAEIIPDVLADLSGYNDVRDCFGKGDILACAGLLPWAKAFKLIRNVAKIVSAFFNAGKILERANAAVAKLKHIAKIEDEIRDGLTACKLHSFPPGTQVLMADGSRKPIEQVEIGDLVIAVDPDTGQPEPRKVTATWVHDDEPERTEITVDTDGSTGAATATLNGTVWHPVWVPDLKTWVPIGNLTAGSWLQTSAGTWVQVTAVRHYFGSGTVHDLTVDDVHTYYVGAGTTDLLVHNCDKTYQTYTKEHPDGTVYSGRTSGTGTPEQNVARRDSGHHMNDEGYGPAVLDRSSSNPDAIRGREQQLIDANGGAQSTGGSSGNRINGVRSSNPKGPRYENAANEEFG